VRFRDIVLYDDVFSFFHTLIAFLSVVLDIHIPVTLCYLAYELREKEKWRFKKGDYIEYVIGLILGGFARAMFGFS